MACNTTQREKSFFTMSKLRSRKPEIIEVPGHDLNAGSRRLSIVLPRFVNLIIRDSFKLTFNEFKIF